MGDQKQKYERRKALKKRIKAEWGNRLDNAKSKFKHKADFHNKSYSEEYSRCIVGYMAANAELKRYIHSSIAFLYLRKGT